MANYEDSAPVHTLPVTHEINGLRYFICSLFDMTSKQTEAVQTRLSSVMGPPGTGKTFVMSVAIILQLLEDHGSALSLPASKIVVVAPSNVAVDAQLGSFHKNLVKLKEKLEAGRVNSLYRNVVQTVINEYLFHQSNCMAKEKGVAATTDNAKHKVPLVHRAYPINGKNLDQDLRFKYELNRVRRQHARVFFLTIDMAIRYNMTARFAEGSELGALSTDCMRTGVRHVFVDEASCIHVAKLFVLLSMFPLDHLSESSDIESRLRLRLFGDEKQLTPYVPPHARVGYKDVQSVELTKKNVVMLGVNPMILSKLYYSHSRVQLDVCFRGPSGLYNFIFKEHYDGLVECVDKTNTRPRYVKVDHPSATKANSVYNEGHWDVIKSFVQSTIDETPEMEITILTPYVAQKNLIRRKLVAYLSQIDATENMVKNIKVRTIDEYQGREADCIILSLPNEKYGFLQDKFDELNNDYLSRRTIVALTRVKKQMIVIGNMAPVTELKTRCTLEEYLHKECEIREEAEDGQ
ncbi:hypothetical protein L596_025559 [Steinernema carpocapsae]|uniref:DNA2/NAM7 helicase-like C-terminal domain-containing protein n=1 Tax=Steinernema carpocapsae TaxID=34508 RepID=A0A4V5ZYU7_STECR|nr:hypothetical protein L596_025559 [Steinernema carpocapsae]